MWALLIKSIPYLWPLLKEFLEGKKDHPYFKDVIRAKSKSRILAFILLLLVLIIGGWAYDLHTTNEELTKKLEQPKPFAHQEPMYSRAHVDLAVCERDRQEAKLDIVQLQTTTAKAEMEAKQCRVDLEWERLNKPTKTPSRPNTKPKSEIGNDVQKRLDGLPKDEGISRASY